MSNNRKLYFLILILLTVLGLFILEILKLSNRSPEVVGSNLSQDLIGNFSRLLLSNQTKNLTISWVDPQKGLQEKPIPLGGISSFYLRQYTGQNEIRVNFSKLRQILENLAPAVQKDPVNANLTYDPASQKVKEFSLPQNGQTLKINESASAITENLAQNKFYTSLIIQETIPQISQNSLGELGLTALLAKGESDFKGSTLSRIHNIGIGAVKFSGLLIKPGEEFSFNQSLGPVDETQGYLYELVIKNGKIAPEFGGGLCQVATTMFRAAVNAGLPILERHPHSFPVHYYNPQGFDATIYPGSTDLRFKNDTPAYLLIQSQLQGTKLTFEVFGSADGRQVTLTGPKILEKNPDGSMKTVLFRKIVAADGTSKEDSFWSNYKSPLAFPLEKNPLE